MARGAGVAWGATLLAGLLLLPACSSDELVTARSADAATTAPTTTTTTTTTAAPTTTTTTAPTTTTTAAPTSTEPPLAAPSAVDVDRDHVVTGFGPYATAGALTLSSPADVIEIIGMHQSNHEGALDQDPVENSPWIVELQTRGRATGPRTAADIVAQPETEIRAPVTGTVARASDYILYCNITDEYLVINPDDDPALEVKVLHVVGLTVVAGDRVIAGETVVAQQAHSLPFRSQVDRYTAEPSWPHVHIEVIDPSIPNVPNGGTGSDDC